MVSFRITAASSAIFSGTSRMISSCTVPITQAPVSANLWGRMPNAFFVMSAAVPWAGVLKSLVISGVSIHAFGLRDASFQTGLISITFAAPQEYHSLLKFSAFWQLYGCQSGLQRREMNIPNHLTHLETLHPL